MTIVEVLILLLVAAICGSIAMALTGFGRGGLLVAIVVGFIGAMLGTAIARGVDAPEYLTIRVGEAQFPILWSIIGATLFVAVVAMLTPRRTID